MKAADLCLDELLEAAEGQLRFGGQRALIFDAVAIGLLRRELVDGLGRGAAQGILTRLGYAHGWRTAETLRDAFAWDEPREWRAAGGRLHTLQGLVRVEALPSPDGPYAAARWHDSYEAAQHLMHFGREQEPVCWTLTGFASGYLSCCHGLPVIAVEAECVGCGDAVCRFEAKPRGAWEEGTLSRVVPFYEQPCLEAALAAAAATLKTTERRLRVRRARLRVDADEPEGTARSSEFRRVLALARRTARVDATALVTGESGVGKERVARLIHAESPRAAGPFVPVDCGAIAEGLLESELFGHARGAFTGAVGERVGLFEAAQGGTLFMDEIGELPLGTQAKLLRVLQEREVRRVGETRARPIDVRVVAATNRDLRVEVQTGGFREDLFYRLNVVELRIPPLRERAEDLLPLARELLAQVSARLKRRVTGFTPAAADQLRRYAWPGNVRELANAIERAVVVVDGGRIDVGDLPEEVRSARRRTLGAPQTLAALERDAILEALRRHRHNRADTAAELGIGVATLYRKLRRYRAEGVASADEVRRESP